MPTDRNRMILDIPAEIQMAIRLRAVKSGITTGEVVEAAVIEMFPEDVAQARTELALRDNVPTTRKLSGVI